MGTKAVHAGEGGRGFEDVVPMPIAQTATYTFRDTEELVAYQEGRKPSYEYGRYGNYTTQAAEDKIRLLEGAEDCLISSSGMSTATTMLLALVPPGGHLITTTDCYRRTRQFIQSTMPKLGVASSVVPPGDLDGLLSALHDQDKPSPAIFFSESPTNPYLRCIDLERVVPMCHEVGCNVIIDSTFATPVNQSPLSFGADLVVHSASKYLAGHHDVLAGALAGSSRLVSPVRELQSVLGGVADPHAAFLLLRGLKTLPLRVRQANATALRLATTLSTHPKIAAVHYPGLESHPDAGIAARQMRGFGGVLSFEVKGGLWDAARVIDSVRIPYIAPSLGGTETLIEQPSVISYWDKGPEGRADLGIRDNLIRLAVGVEEADDLEADLLQALDRT